jgi:hypothetical protein
MSILSTSLRHSASSSTTRTLSPRGKDPWNVFSLPAGGGATSAPASSMAFWERRRQVLSLLSLSLAPKRAPFL